MKRWIICGVWWLVATAPAWAQVAAVELAVFPDPGQAAGLVRTASDGRWVVLTDDMTPVDVQSFRLESGGSVCWWQGDPGQSFGVLFIPDDVAEGIATRKVTLSGSPPVPDDDDPTENPWPAPSAELRRLAEPVVAIAIQPADALALGKIYAETASLIRMSADPAAANALRTTTAAREYHQRLGQSLELGGRYAGLSAAAEAFMKASVGMEVRETTEADAAAFDALAWAVCE